MLTFLFLFTVYKAFNTKQEESKETVLIPDASNVVSHLHMVDSVIGNENLAV